MKVGDKLLLVYSRRREPPKEVTVSKVGRKWAYIEDEPRYRLALEGNDNYTPGVVYDGDWSVGYTWESRAAYDEHQRLLDLRDDFTDRVRNGMLPRDAEKLRRAWAILWGDKA